jgi:hypothetical protein
VLFVPGSARMRKRSIVDLDTHPDPFITVQVFAEHLTVQDKTVRKWIHAGLLPSYRRRPPVLSSGRL